MAKEIQVSSDELSKEGYSALAVKTPDNKLDASRLDTEAAREEAAKLAKALNAKTSKIQGVTASDLSVLLKEAEQVSQSDSDEDGEGSGSENLDVPSSIKKAADAARSQVKTTFGNVADKDYASHMSNMRALLLKWMPGLEVSSIEDISDAMYQSDTYISKLIDYLEQQAADPSLSLNFGITGNYNPLDLISMLWGKVSGDENKKLAPGMYPSGNIDFKTPEEKQEYIQAMLQKLTSAMQGRKTGAWFSKETAQDGAWIGLVMLGGYIGGKIAIGTLKGVLNVVTFGKFAKLAGVVQGDPHAIDKARKVGGIAKKVWGMRPGAKPAESSSAASGTAPTEHARELNLANNKLDAVTSEAILRNIYNAERVAANLAPLADTAKLPTEWTPDGLSINNLNAYNLYHERIKQYLSLPDRPSDPTKLSEWKQELGRIIRGEVKPGTIWRPKWLGGTSASERADYTTNATARTDVAHKVMRSAVAEANVVEWTYGGLTVKLSGEMQPLTQELSVKEAEHTKKMKELQALVDEKARLEGLKRQLEKRMQEEITIESNAAEIKRLEGEIAKLNDATTGKVADTQTKVDAKNLEIAKHRETFKDPMGQIDGSKFDADSQTTKLKGELRALEGELAKHNRSLERLEKTLSDLESTQRQNITSYREKYRSSPRLSTVTADKLKGVGSAGTHGDGIEEKIKANEQVQQSKINELKRVWTEIKDIGVRMEATPKMAGKLNGLVVSDASIKTSIGGKEIEIKSLKGLTQKIMQIGAEAFKVGTKG